jgi:iron complex transport system substrate-binding protein
MSTPHEIAYTIIWGRQLEEGAQERQYVQEGAQETLEESPAEDAQGKETLQQAGLMESEETQRQVELIETEEALQRAGLTETEKALQRAGLTKTGELIPTYAEGFRVSAYGDYRYIKIRDFGEYLLIPEGGGSSAESGSSDGSASWAEDSSSAGDGSSVGDSIPAGLPDGVTILQKPLDRVYLVSTSAMDLIIKCGALERIRLSGTKESDWYVPEAAEEMEADSTEGDEITE